jgi:hypothetical protein
MPVVSKLTSFRVSVSLVEQCCSLRWYLAARVIQIIVAFANLKRQKENQNIDKRKRVRITAKMGWNEKNSDPPMGAFLIQARNRFTQDRNSAARSPYRR